MRHDCASVIAESLSQLAQPWMAFARPLVRRKATVVFRPKSSIAQKFVSPKLAPMLREVDRGTRLTAPIFFTPHFVERDHDPHS